MNSLGTLTEGASFPTVLLPKIFAVIAPDDDLSNDQRVEFKRYRLVSRAWKEVADGFLFRLSRTQLSVEREWARFMCVLDAFNAAQRLQPASSSRLRRSKNSMRTTFKEFLEDHLLSCSCMLVSAKDHRPIKPLLTVYNHRIRQLDVFIDLACNVTKLQAYSATDENLYCFFEQHVLDSLYSMTNGLAQLGHKLPISLNVKFDSTNFGRKLGLQLFETICSLVRRHAGGTQIHLDFNIQSWKMDLHPELIGYRAVGVSRTGKIWDSSGFWPKSIACSLVWLRCPLGTDISSEVLERFKACRTLKLISRQPFFPGDKASDDLEEVISDMPFLENLELTDIVLATYPEDIRSLSITCRTSRPNYPSTDRWRRIFTNICSLISLRQLALDFEIPLPVDNQPFEAPIGCTKLRSLAIACNPCDYLNEMYVAMLRKTPRLEDFTLQTCNPSLCYYRFDAAATHNLTSIDLRWISPGTKMPLPNRTTKPLTWSDLAKWLSSNPQLGSLRVGVAPHASTIGVRHIERLADSLKSLDVVVLESQEYTRWQSMYGTFYDILGPMYESLLSGEKGVIIGQVAKLGLFKLEIDLGKFRRLCGEKTLIV